MVKTTLCYYRGIHPFNTQLKHIKRYVLGMRHGIDKGSIKLYYIATAEMHANLLTTLLVIQVLVMVL